MDQSRLCDECSDRCVFVCFGFPFCVLMNFPLGLVLVWHFLIIFGFIVGPVEIMS